MSTYASVTVDLLSRGVYYPSTSPFASGKIEIKKPTAREEDIFSDINNTETYLEKVIKSVLLGVNKDEYKNLLLSDCDGIYNDIMTLAYGAKIKITAEDGNEYEVDRSTLKVLNQPSTDQKNNDNKFTFVLPESKKTITYRLLTVKDKMDISNELEQIKKNLGENSDEYNETIITLKKQIIAVDGISDVFSITTFVNNFSSLEYRAFKKELSNITPVLDTRVSLTLKDGKDTKVNIRLMPSFLVPALQV